MKVSFDIVSLEAEKSFSLSNDIDIAMRSYVKTIRMFGWSMEDFNNKLLETINANWMEEEKCSN